jgi:tRNA threonylcarbamoyladenosine biosynthesis protein TsaE
MATIISQSVEQTILAGEDLAGSLPVGTVVSISGDLGAGKTHFIKGLARAFGVEAEVTSPTFPIIHEYPARDGIFVHIDFYRLEDVTDAGNLGLDELFETSLCTAVEWGEKFSALLPVSAISVNIRAIDESTREILVCEP